MRYILHLLPEEAQRRAYDAARARLVEVIGRNRALDYPTAHVTLVWSIQDEAGDPDPIRPAALIAALEEWRSSGRLVLETREELPGREHLLLPLNDSPTLAALRGRLAEAARVVAAGTGSARAERAGRVREQTWPHLTFAQEIDPARWERGRALLDADFPDLLREPLHGGELALVARDNEVGGGYTLAHRVSLSD
jgi:hypothetical protein